MTEALETSGYIPTEKESILLDIMLNPENRLKSVTDVCKLANCSRTVYYEAFQKPGFCTMYEEKAKALVRQNIGPILNTFVKEALRGSFQHGKVLLEMAGLVQTDETTDSNVVLIKIGD